MRKRYSEDDIKYIESQALLGTKPSIIADIMGMVRRTISRHLNKS